MPEIKTVNFFCPPQGNHFQFPVQIKLPATCCKIPTIVKVSLLGADYLESGCHAHMSSYKEIWQNFFIRKYGLLHGVINPYGIDCKVCGTRNDQANPTEMDGSYICYKCRNGY